MCEAAHTSSEIGELLLAPLAAAARERPRDGGRHAKNQPMGSERTAGPARPALARDAPPA
jgi:hypothetical protein